MSGLRHAAIIGALLTTPGALGAQAPVTFGILADGPSFHDAAFRPRLIQEIRTLLGPDFDARFPAEQSLTADWTSPGVEAELRRLLDDPVVDLVVTFGAIAAGLAADLGPLPKPVVAAFVLDAEVQGLPMAHGSSGVPNFTYVAYPTAFQSDLAAFREVATFDNVAVLVERAYLLAVPGLLPGIEGAIRSQGIQGRIVPVGTTIDLALGMVASGFDAVYVGYLPQISEQDTDRLIRFLQNNRLPSYTALGQTWVERGFLTSAVSELVGQHIARRAAGSVRRILLGEDPATIPVIFTRDQRVSINLATARAIGVSPPWAIMTEAVLFHQEQERVEREVSLGSAVREAVARNLDLLAEGYAVSAGDQQVRGARAPLLPQVDAAIDARVIDADRAASSFGREPERAVAGSATLVQQLYSDRTWANYSIERYAQAGRVQLRDEVRLDVILSAASAYLSLLRAKSVERIVQDNLRASRANLELAEVRSATGAAAAGEVARWESEIARNRQEVISAHSIRSVLQIDLNRILDRPLEDPLGTVEVRPEDVEVITNHPRLEPYLQSQERFRIFRNFMAQEALTGSPELRRIDAAIAAQRREVTAASRAFFVPDLALIANTTNVWGKSGAGADPPPGSGIVPNDLGWGVGLRLTYPLFTGLARSAAKSGATLELRALTTERAATADRIEQRLRGAMLAMGASYANVGLARASAAAARRNLSLVTEAYGSDAASVTDLIDAQDNALLAELDAANTAYAFLIDLMEVERAVGAFTFFISRDEREAFLDRLDAFAAGQLN